MVSKSERGLHENTFTVILFCRGTILQLCWQNITERKSGKISTADQHFTWHHLWELPKLFRDRDLKLKRKKITFTHSSTRVLSFLPFFFLTHRRAYTLSLAAVGPLSGDQHQSLDPPAPRWGQKLGQASTEPPSPCAARNTVPLSTGPERRAH